MAHGFAVGEGTALSDQRAWFVVDGAELAAVGTGVVGRKGLSLLFQEGGESPFGQPAGGGAATCSRVVRSVSRPGPPSPKARRATILPHWAAKSRILWSSWGVNLEVAIGCPALNLRRATLTDSPDCFIAKWLVRQSRS